MTSGLSALKDKKKYKRLVIPKKVIVLRPSLIKKSKSQKSKEKITYYFNYLLNSFDNITLLLIKSAIEETEAEA